jgi:hypothetical protein
MFVYSIQASLGQLEYIFFLSKITRSNLYTKQTDTHVFYQYIGLEIVDPIFFLDEYLILKFGI